MHFAGIISLLSLSSLTAGHFILNYPPTIGFSDDLEDQGPCGSFDPSSSNHTLTSITAGGFPLEVRSIHPQAEWLIRATLDKTAPFNWTNLLPVVAEVGLGDFCIPDVKAPAKFIGQSGIVQVMQDAVDGILFQCSTVMFVAGTNTSVGSACNNVTGLTANITNQQAFGNASSTSATASMTMTMSTSATGSASTSPTSKSGAARLICFGQISTLLTLLGVVASLAIL